MQGRQDGFKKRGGDGSSPTNLPWGPSPGDEPSPPRLGEILESTLQNRETGQPVQRLPRLASYWGSRCPLFALLLEPTLAPLSRNSQEKRASSPQPSRPLPPAPQPCRPAGARLLGCLRSAPALTPKPAGTTQPPVWSNDCPVSLLVRRTGRSVPPAAFQIAERTAFSRVNPLSLPEACAGPGCGPGNFTPAPWHAKTLSKKPIVPENAEARTRQFMMRLRVEERRL